LVILPEVDCRQRWVVKLDRLGVAVSTGSACATGKEQVSHVLTSMGFSEREASRAVRVSSGWEHEPQDWKDLADVFLVAARQLGVL
jgi:cysteine desulfurase